MHKKTKKLEVSILKGIDDGQTISLRGLGNEGINGGQPGDLLEYTEYCGNFYGTPRKEAEEGLASGKNLILEIEVEGAANIKRKFPDAVTIMLLQTGYVVPLIRKPAEG